MNEESDYDLGDGNQLPMNQEIGAFEEEASPAKKADSPSVGDKRLAEVSPEEMKQAL